MLALAAGDGGRRSHVGNLDGGKRNHRKREGRCCRCRPWSNGTSSVDLAPLALIARLAALVPFPRRHTVIYCGVLSSHASYRSQVIPAAPEPAPPHAGHDKAKCRPKHIRWSDLLRLADRTAGWPN